MKITNITLSEQFQNPVGIPGNQKSSPITSKRSNYYYFFFFFFFLHHNIVYSKFPVYNNLNGPGVNIKGPCFT
jgi:hypothetical protein